MGHNPVRPGRWELHEGCIPLELRTAPIDNQGRQFITDFCILMVSYFSTTAWRSVVMTSWRDISRLPLLDWSGTSRAVNSATVRRNPLVVCLSSGIVLPQILCAQNMTSLVPRNRNSSPLSCKLSWQPKATIVTKRRTTLRTGRPLPEGSFKEILHLLLPEVSIGFNWQQPRWTDPNNSTLKEPIRWRLNSGNKMRWGYYRDR